MYGHIYADIYWPESFDTRKPTTMHIKSTLIKTSVDTFISEQNIYVVQQYY